MVGEEVINNSEIIESISSIVLDRISPFMGIFKAVSIVFIVYVGYMIIRWFFRWKDRRRLKRVEKKVDEINGKLDRLLKKETEKKELGKGDRKKKAKKKK
jgi:hypothetical protein